jgi:DNA polymerase-4
LRKKKVKAGTVILKLKTPDFKLVTRSRSLGAHTQSTDVIYQNARMLLDNFRLETKVRLIGVGVSGLLPERHPVQMDLFEESGGRSIGWEKVDRAIDGIAEKYGSQVVKRASTYKK